MRPLAKTLPLIVASAHAVLLAIWLTRPTSDRQTHLLDGWLFDRLGTLNTFIAVPLTRTQAEDGNYRYRLEVTEFFRTNLTSAESVAFRLEISDEDGPTDRLRSAPVPASELRFESSTGGHLFSAPDGPIRSGNLVEFRRVSFGTNAASGTNAYTLSFRSQAAVRVGLRCNGGAARSPGDFRPDVWPGILSVGLPAQKEDPPGLKRWGFPQGSYSTQSQIPPPIRVEILRRWWGFETPALWWLGFATSSFLLWAACSLLPTRTPRSDWQTGPTRVVAGAFLFSLALSADFALVAPPFQGPDEASHLVSILRWRGTPGQVDEYLRFGHSTHAARLSSRPEQKFTAADLEAPQDWFVFSVSDMDSNVPMRSALATRLWSFAWSLWGDHPVPSMLIGFRIFSAVVVCLMIGVAAGLTGPGFTRPLCIFLLLFAPSLTWFAMTVSNWAFATGLAFVAVGSLVRIAGGNRDGVAGFALGLSMGLALQNSATLITWVSGLSVTLLGIAAWGKTETGRSIIDRKALTLWTSITLSSGLCAMIGTPQHDLLMAKWAAKLGRVSATELPWWLVWWGGLILAGTIGAGVEAFSSWLRLRLLSKSAAEARSPFFQRFRWVPLTAFLGWQLWNLATPTPILPPMKEPLPSWEFQARLGLPSMSVDNWRDTQWRLKEWPYVGRTIAAVAGSFGIGDHDHLTSVLFWSYIGYNDVWLPDALISLLVAIFGLGFLGWLIPQSTVKYGYDPGTVIFWFLGAIVCLGLTAAASAFSEFSPSIHGRYLIPFYVTFLGFCSLGGVRFWERRCASVALPWAIGSTLILIVHHCSLSCIATRYF